MVIVVTPLKVCYLNPDVVLIQRFQPQVTLTNSKCFPDESDSKRNARDLAAQWETPLRTKFGLLHWANSNSYYTRKKPTCKKRKGYGEFLGRHSANIFTKKFWIQIRAEIHSIYGSAFSGAVVRNAESIICTINSIWTVDRATWNGRDWNQRTWNDEAFRETKWLQRKQDRDGKSRWRIWHVFRMSQIRKKRARFSNSGKIPHS